MRLAFVNLPHPFPVIRRYMCSYNAPVFLFPPLELMYAATTARDWGGHSVRVIDSIAEQLDRKGLFDELSRFRPDLVVSLLGFEILDTDIRELRWLRQSLPEARFVVFGHYASTFPVEILDLVGVDFVIRGEPEFACHELAQALASGGPLDQIQGLCYRGEDGRARVNPERPRLKPVDELPYPDQTLVNMDHYSEFLFPKRFTIMQTARGCPYACNFCVRSYGQKLTYRSPENIVGEIEILTKRHGVRSLRFMDDTFTAVPARTIAICEGIRERFPDLIWSCLSRIDTMDEERAVAMRAAGCARVYVGIESGSERILKLYGKDYEVERVPRTVDLLRKHGFEVGAFFMVGHPEETEEDFAKTIRMVRSLEIDYATIGKTIAYPGTLMYDQYRDQVDFSLFPYQNDWKNSDRRRQLQAWEKRFYREMYFRPRYVARNAWRLVKNPRTTLQCGRALLPFMFGSGVAGARNELI